MDFELNDEQHMLRDAAGKALASDITKRNAITATELGWSQDVWKQLAEMGVLGLPFAESDGGSGAGPIETMVVMTEIGRTLAPEPYLDAVLVAGGLVAAAGTDAQRAAYLTRIAEGTVLLALAHAEPGTRWPSAQVATTAKKTDDGWTLTGHKNPVLHGDCADVLIVSASLPDGGVGLFLVDADATGVARKTYATHDGLRGAQVELTDAPGEQLGAGDATAAIVDSDVRAQAALCAEAIGAMTEALRLTTDYLKQRKQFGVTLSTFQALTHRAADMYVALELASSMSLYANMSLADGVVDPIIASRAKLAVGRTARLIGQEAIQLHGGIGMTAEYAVGHYVSRLTAIGHTLGSTEDHLRVLTADVAGHEMLTLTD
ncbi:MAG: acyl-CoA dehydrogenase family protein [Jatrophihabitantaceae bacterium]